MLSVARQRPWFEASVATAQQEDAENDVSGKDRLFEYGSFLVSAVDALRRAPSEKAFFKRFNALARPDFIPYVERVSTDPEIDISAVRIVVRDPYAGELFADLVERGDLLIRIAASREVNPPRDAARHRSYVYEAGKYALSVVALAAATYAKERWQRSIIGWTSIEGEKAVTATGQLAGLPLEVLDQELLTARDRRLMAEPFDPVKSEMTRKLLGL
jgi:hypothetical protein